MKKEGMLVLLFGAFFLSACSEKMPEVNDENCKIENINSIKDDAIRAAFSSKCFRSGEVKATGRDKGF